MANKRPQGVRKGLTPKTFQGMSRTKVMAGGGGGTGAYKHRVKMKKGTSHVLQFITGLDEFLEYEQHVFRDDEGRWRFVPCGGEDCPLCHDEREDVARTSYSFACLVWNFREKRVMILAGGKKLGLKIYQKWEKCGANANARIRNKKFVQRVYEITALPTNPADWIVDLEPDVRPKDPKILQAQAKKKDAPDLEAYVKEEMEFYFGNSMPKASSLDEDDEDEWDRPRKRKVSKKSPRVTKSSSATRTRTTSGDRRRSRR